MLLIRNLSNARQVIDLINEQAATVTHIKIAEQELKDFDFSDLQKLPHLQTIEILDPKSFEWVGPFLNALPHKAPNLEVIEISQDVKSQARSYGLSVDPNLPLTKLNKFKLERCYYTAKVHNLVLSAPKLKVLEIVDSPISVLKSDLTGLTEINLSGSLGNSKYDLARVVKDLNELLKNNPKLEKLNIFYCLDFYLKPEDEQLHIEKNTVINLKEFSAYNSTMPLNFLRVICEDNPKLEKLDIGFCAFSDKTNVEGYIPVAIDINLTALKEFTSLFTQVKPHVLKNIIKNNPKLEAFGAGCEELKLEDADLHGLITLVHLKKLSLSNTKITGSTLQAIIHNNPNLEEVDLRNCENLTDADLQSLTRLKNLKVLRLGQSAIASSTLQAIVINNPNLEKINIFECNNLKDFDLPKSTRLPMLKKIRVFECNIPAAVVAKIIYNYAMEMHGNIFELVECLNSFKEYARETGFIVKLLLEQIKQQDVPEHQMRSILQAQCLDVHKKQLLQVWLSSPFTKNESIWRIEEEIKAFILKKMLYNNNNSIRNGYTGLTGKKILAFIGEDDHRWALKDLLDQFQKDCEATMPSELSSHISRKSSM